MKGFFKVKSVDEVLAIINEFEPLDSEEVSLEDAHGRILSESVISPEDLPLFSRSTMDGFAVRAKDTFGATEGLPALFSIVGEVRMGEEPDVMVSTGEAARIWTGGMLPSGSDAVLPLEYARDVDDKSVELARAVAPADHVILAGEDVKKGRSISFSGQRLKPQDLGLLAALGISGVKVRKKPRAAIISTGDEIVDVTATPRPGQVRDINTYTLSALTKEAGAVPYVMDRAGDQFEDIKKAVELGLEKADTVILSGGSSVGVRDFTVAVFESFPGSEILVHGISVSPGKPTILARLGNKSLWGLPGHATAAMITFDLFLNPLLAKLSGFSPADPLLNQQKARLSRNLASVHGREDYVRVSIGREPDGEVIAQPVLGKSGLISTMVKADGLIRIGRDVEGLKKGSMVEVMLFRDF